MAVALLLVAAAVAAQSSPQGGLSLDQAVVRVQQQVGGKILSAEPRQVSRKVEYRIKVLTPEGHVRVITVPSDATRTPPAAQSTKKFPNGGSKKEKH
jgi:ABC-type siderophore export system fused ATPase/permease subunit